MRAAAFRYRAARADGSIVRGTIPSADEGAAKQQLLREGLSVIRLQPVRPRWTWEIIPRRDLAVAFRNVALLVSEGVPIERALGASEDLVGRGLRQSIVRVRGMVREGSSVAEAMETDLRAFPRPVVGILRAGEQGSRLAEACETVADQLEGEVRLRSELWSALTYPTLVLLVGLSSVVVIGAVVLPRFGQVFAGLGNELPPATQALMTLSELLRRFGAAAAFVALGLGIAGLRWLRSERVRLPLDRLLLSAPMVGNLRLGFASARTCRALGGMLSAGMPLLSAIDVARAATGDLEVSQRLGRVREEVIRGGRLSDALRKHRALTPFALQLVGVGESSGKLGSMVSRAGDAAAERAQRSLRALVNIVEPVLILGLGCLVAAVSAALLQAVYSVRL